MNKNPFSFASDEPSPPPPPRRGASQKPVPAPPAASPTPPPSPTYPWLVDYFVLLLGFALSVFLCRVGPLPVAPKPFVAASLRPAVAALPDMMRLPEGALLMWPIFLVTQRLRGRKQGLTSIEWLWVISWVGVAGLAGLTAWKDGLGYPDAVQGYLLLAPRLWYVILVPSMAAVAVVLRVVSLLSRRPAPWTHSFGLALLVWPVLPLAGVLTAATFTG